MREAPRARATLYSREPYHLGLYIPGIPAMNTSATRAHAMMQSRKAAEDRQLICVLIPRRLRPAAPLARARVTMTRHSATVPDDDNLRLSFKGLLDALCRDSVRTKGKRKGETITRANVLEDDRASCVERVYLHDIAPRGKGYMTIAVEELPGGSAKAAM